MPYVSKRTPAERFWRNVDVIDDADSCWRWTRHLDLDGYGSFYVGPNQKAQRASRYAWFLATGQPAGELCVCHHCDNPCCVRPSHLFLGTRSDNMRDAVAKGRHRHAVIPNRARARGPTMSLAAAAWCVACGAPPDVALTIERRGTLAHYGACWDHAAGIIARARADAARLDAEDRARLAGELERQRLHLTNTPSGYACRWAGGHGWTSTYRICFDVDY